MVGAQAKAGAEVETLVDLILAEHVRSANFLVKLADNAFKKLQRELENAVVELQKAQEYRDELVQALPENKEKILAAADAMQAHINAQRAA